MAPTATPSPSSQSSSSPSSPSASSTTSPDCDRRQKSRSVADGMYHYLTSAAQHGTGIERQMAEARLLLERRVDDGEFEVGDAAHKTRLVERLGSGSYGDVYLGLTESTQTKVAVKMELSCCPSSIKCLLYEGDVYRKLTGCPGIPTVRWFGMHGSDYSALVMDLLGPTLFGVWTQLGQRFSMHTLLAVVDQTLETIKHVHGRGYVHRDISPSNLMLGPGKDRLYLIDFGQAKKPAPMSRARHRLSYTRPIAGTPRFASIFAHAGVEPAYRDDMESLGYLWVYLATGRLPWQGIHDCNGLDKIQRIGQMKVSTPLDELCAGLPQEFETYIAYARHLRPHDMPDHEAARRMFRALAAKLGVDDDDAALDWAGVDLDADRREPCGPNPSGSESAREAAPCSASYKFYSA